MITATQIRGGLSPRFLLPDGREFGCPHDAARTLIGEGADPEARMETVHLDGKPEFRPLPLRWWAVRSPSDTDTVTRFVWWAPHPRANPPAALVAVLAQAAAERAAAREVAAARRKPLAPRGARAAA